MLIPLNLQRQRDQIINTHSQNLRISIVNNTKAAQKAQDVHSLGKVEAQLLGVFVDTCVCLVTKHWHVWLLSILQFHLCQFIFHIAARTMAGVSLLASFLEGEERIGVEIRGDRFTRVVFCSYPSRLFYPPFPFWFPLSFSLLSSSFPLAPSLTNC